MFISEKCKGECYYVIDLLPSLKDGQLISKTYCKRCGRLKNVLGALRTTDKDIDGVISSSMNVDTKPSKKLEYKGYWILVDGKISDEDFNELKNKFLQ